MHLVVIWGLVVLAIMGIKAIFPYVAAIVGVWLLWKLYKYLFAPSIEVDDGEEEVLLLPPPSEEVKKELEAQAKKG